MVTSSKKHDFVNSVTSSKKVGGLGRPLAQKIDDGKIGVNFGFGQNAIDVSALAGCKSAQILVG